MSEKNLVERRPAETTTAVGGVLGAGLAVILGRVFGFSNDTELVLAVGSIITITVGFMPSVVTWWDLRSKKR